MYSVCVCLWVVYMCVCVGLCSAATSWKNNADATSVTAEEQYCQILVFNLNFPVGMECPFASRVFFFLLNPLSGLDQL